MTIYNTLLKVHSYSCSTRPALCALRAPHCHSVPGHGGVRSHLPAAGRSVALCLHHPHHGSVLGRLPAKIETKCWRNPEETK